MPTRNLTRAITTAITRAITQAGAGGEALDSAVRALFANGEQGIWLDPSDFTTMFQDAAGTTPVTAVEQPVGKILDKSGRGNHASQTAAASRPVLSARKNWLLATTTLATQSATLIAAAYTLSFKGTGTVTLSGASTAGPLVGTGVGNRVSLTFTPTAGSVTFTVSGSVTEAQLEYGSAVGAYQSVVTATNYDTVGFPHYLKFDGVDDFLVTGNVDFTATDAMTVMAGIRKDSNSGTRHVVSLSTTPYVANGTWLMAAPVFTAPSLGYYSRGTAGAANNVNNATYGIGWTGVFTGQSRISTDTLIGRANGVQVFTASADQGSGNYISAPLYIGREAGTGSAFLGNIYQLIVRGDATADVTPGEAFVNGKTGAY